MSFSNLICSRLVTYCVEQSKAYEYRMTDLWMDALKAKNFLVGINLLLYASLMEKPLQRKI